MTSPVTLGQCAPSGPIPASILVIGEAPGAQEVLHNTPFIGPSGTMLRNTLIGQANLTLSDCRVTNVTPHRPENNDIKKFFATKTQGKHQQLPCIHNQYCHWPILEGLNALIAEIDNTNPSTILAVGGTALWALTGETSIEKWHGSQLVYDGRLHTALGKPFNHEPIQLLPVYHPAYLLRNKSLLPAFQADIRRLTQRSHSIPSINYTVLRTLDQALSFLNSINEPVIVDIETNGELLLCIGFLPLSGTPHILPFSTYNIACHFPLYPEIEIIQTLQNTQLQAIGQYFQKYDRPWLSRQYGLNLACIGDIFIAEGILNPGHPRDLSAMSALYCKEHVYWKDTRSNLSSSTDDELFQYNVMDLLKTREIYLAQQSELQRRNLMSQYNEQMEISETLYRLSIQGIACNQQAKAQLKEEIRLSTQRLEDELRYVAPMYPDGWWRSSTQLRDLCYRVFPTLPVLDRKTRKPTVGKDAIPTLIKREPILGPILTRASDLRTLAQAQAFIDQAEDPITHRIPISLSATGAVTMRFTCATDPFGYGGNVQAISDGRTDLSRHSSGFQTPNLRSLFQPDRDHYIMETDFKQADAHIVAWDSHDETLMDYFTRMRLGEPLDLHTENAKSLFKTSTVTKAQRQFTKTAVHAMNYGVQARTLAISLGIPIAEAHNFIQRWFSLHPAIQAWQLKIGQQLERTNSLTTIWGYQYRFYESVGKSLQKALSFIGQGGVAILCIKTMLKLQQVPGVTLLSQNHDSIIYQFPKDLYPGILPSILDAFQVEVPYPTPLIIPSDHKISSISWGNARPFDPLNPPTEVNF